MTVNINEIAQIREKIIKDKDLWKAQFRTVGEFVHMLKQEFDSEVSDGSFLTRDIQDMTAPEANLTFAGAMVGSLWPNGAKSFKMMPPEGMDDTSEVVKYFEAINRIKNDAMDDPRAGLENAVGEYMNDQGSLGTSGIMTEVGDKSEELELSYKAYGVQRMAIAEGKSGFVDTVVLDLKWSAKRLVQEYGKENVSQKVLEKLKSDPNIDDIRFSILIMPRKLEKISKDNSKEMPFMSIHWEHQTKKLLKESGFLEFPMSVGRITKLHSETYGRSPAMNALPAILRLNYMAGLMMTAAEKKLNPPLGVLNGALNAGGVLDTSAKAINVLKTDVRSGNVPPVFPIQDVGDIQEALLTVQDLREQVTKAFKLDKLLDFNNQTQMTATETSIRDRIRSTALGSMFSRQYIELFIPLIERSVNVILRNNKLGLIQGSREHQLALSVGQEPLVIPDAVREAMAKGDNWYRIEFFTPASRLMKAEQKNGIIETWQIAGQIAQFKPEVLNGLKELDSIRLFGDLAGAPDEIFETIEDAKAIGQAQREAQAAQAQAEQENVRADTAKKESEAQ